MALGLIPDAQTAPTAPNATVAPNAPPNATPNAPLTLLDANGQPIPPPDTLGSDAEAFGKLVGRSVIGKAMAPFDLAVTGGRAIGKEIDRTGLTTPASQQPPGWFHQYVTPYLPAMFSSPHTDAQGQPELLNSGDNAPLPSQQLIADVSKYVPLQMDPNASTAMKVADYLGPLILSGGESGVAKATSVANAPLAIAKEIGLQGAGAAGATAAGEGAKYLGADDLGTLIASIAGGGGALKAGQAFGVKKVADTFADPDAPQTLEDAEALGVKPTFGMLANPRGKMLEANMAANPFAGGAIKEHMANTQENLNQRVGQEAGNVGYGGVPLNKSRDTDVMGEDLTAAAQQRQIELDRASSAAQGEVDTKAAAYPPDVSPLVQQITKLTRGPDVDPTMTAPLDTRLNALLEMQRRQNPLPAGFEPNTVPPTTASYPALKDWTSNLGKKISGVDPLQGRDMSQVYPTAVDALHGSAEQAGAGAESTAARAQTRRMYQEQLPPLREFGGKLGDIDPDTGKQLFENVPEAGAAGRQFERAAAVGGNPELMRQVVQQMPPGAVARGLADIVRNAGTKTGDFRLEHFGPAWDDVNDATRGAISSVSPGTPETLDRVQRLSNVFLRKPASSGLTDTLGFQAALAQMPGGLIGKTLGTLALLHGVNSNSMLNAMAGRGGMPDLLSGYLRNLPVQQQTAQRVMGR